MGTTLRVRCLGGLEIHRGERAVTGFESRKVRALLAYLVCQRNQAFARDHLAALFWPDKAEEAARRNLRQALYNLKSVLADGAAETPVMAAQDRVQLAADADLWLDVDAFDQALEQAHRGGAVNPHHLAGAVRLYHGEFLSDLLLREETPFEDWLLAERNRLREGMIDALRHLIESYLVRGEHRLGIQYAQRLVALDPLAEEAHRYLMQLYAQAGRRGQALDQYRSLAEILERELDVEPMPETQALHAAILDNPVGAAASTESPEPVGPLIPLVGRGDAFAALGRHWDRARAEGCFLTLVEGESGVGKTRLVRSFLDGASAEQPAVVLLGDCSEHLPLPYQPWPRLLRSVLDDEIVERALAAAPPGLLGELSRLVPELRDVRPDLPSPPPLRRRRLFEAIAELLRALTADGTSVVVFIDDLDRAEAESVELLAFLLARLEKAPIWLLASRAAPSGAESEAWAALSAGDRVERLSVERLDEAAVAEIATWLVGSGAAPTLAELLAGSGRRLPLEIAEQVNFLRDVGALIAVPDGNWQFQPDVLATAEPASFEEMVGKRLRQLPASTRRLATLAAVIGKEFSTDLIREAGEELSSVVAIGLEVMVERWLMRRHLDRWTSRGRERDVSGAELAAREDHFEFANERTRRAVYGQVHRSRRRVMHLQVAEALAGIAGRDTDPVCEPLAFHYAGAEEWSRALPLLLRAVERARRLGAEDSARRWEDRAREALDRLLAAVDTDTGIDTEIDTEELERWRDLRRRLDADQARASTKKAGPKAGPV